jgi:hypothetical protein
MQSNDYHFVTCWRLEGSIDEISDILGDAEGLVRWWPSVYLDVKMVEKGDEKGVGKVISLFTKGWLPYTLRWSFKVVESNAPHGWRIEAIGDFVGRGVWTLEQDGPIALVTYDWRITAEKRLLRFLSFLLKPIFAKNHQWAMRMGEESLRLELLRRHAQTAEARARIPPPPGPTPTSMFRLLATSLASNRPQGPSISPGST